MVGALILALVFPPWETPPSQTPEFLGLHFILQPPRPDAIVSRLLVTIELTTISIAGLYPFSPQKKGIVIKHHA